MANDQELGGLWCHEILQGLSDYLAGDLPKAQAAQVDLHLTQCPHCTQFGADFSKLVKQVQSLSKPPSLRPEGQAALWQVLTQGD